MTIAEAQKKVDHWIKTIGVRYFDEKTNALLLNEEVGELSRLIARVYGEQSFKSKEKEAQAADLIKDEMADILFVLICLANQMSIDLDTALINNLKKKTIRDKERHMGNDKLK